MLRNTSGCVVRSRQLAQARCVAFKHQAHPAATQCLLEKHRATKYDAVIVRKKVFIPNKT